MGHSPLPRHLREPIRGCSLDWGYRVNTLHVDLSHLVRRRFSLLPPASWPLVGSGIVNTLAYRTPPTQRE